MTPEQKELFKNWIAALRSGEYMQSRNGLLFDGSGCGFCCLGVAGSLIGLSADDLTGKTEVGAYETIRKTYGLKSTLGNFGDIALRDSIGYPNLASINDSSDWDFNKIADFIEENQAQLILNN